MPLSARFSEKSQQQRVKEAAVAVGGVLIYEAVHGLLRERISSARAGELDLSEARALVEGRGGNVAAIPNIVELINVERLMEAVQATRGSPKG